GSQNNEILCLAQDDGHSPDDENLRRWFKMMCRPTQAPLCTMAVVLHSNTICAATEQLCIIPEYIK
ncbi:MAG TPA: hypothetical protein PLR54_09445, partial [Spirochaetota bacterium]|nr:hypothetical protein [Spirochaetota bacterium]